MKKILLIIFSVFFLTVCGSTNNEALTAPGISYSAEDIYSPANIETTIQTLTVTVSDAPVILHCSAQIKNASTSPQIVFRIYRNDILISAVSTNTAYPDVRSFTIADTPGSGTFSYTLRVETMGADRFFAHRLLMVLASPL